MENGLPLSDFIRQNVASITREWEQFAKTLSPAADSMTPLGLRDHIKELLSFIAEDMEAAQTKSEQKEKAQGNGDISNQSTIGAIHGGLRFRDGFEVLQMVAEYRALRASIINLWKRSYPHPHLANLDDVTRFNESIDQLLEESLQSFMKRLDYSRDLILGMMGHDIRNPLGAIKMSAELIPMAGVLNERQTVLASQIVGSSIRINQIVTDLLDLTRARTGTVMPIRRASTDIGVIAAQIVTEIRAQNPSREIVLETDGNMEGEWDSIRLGQVFSNLLGNAVQYSPAGSIISVKVTGNAIGVMLAVHNLGTPIPLETIDKIFDFLVRAKETDTAHNMDSSMHMGLGLYIVKQIVLSHGGEINVTSSAKEGTSFTAKFPRIPLKIAV